MEFDDGLGLIMDDTMKEEEDKMELLGLTQEMKRRKMPKHDDFHFAQNEEELRKKDVHIGVICSKHVRVDLRTILVRPFSYVSKKLLVIYSGHCVEGI